METLMALITSQLQSNPFASGGVFLMVLGVLIAQARQVPLRIAGLLRRRLLTSLEVSGDDEAYLWFKHWLYVHPYTRRFRHLQLLTLKPDADAPAPERESPQVLLLPAFGRHLLVHRGHWIWISLEQDRDAEGSSPSRGAQRFAERLKLVTIGADRAFLEQLVAEAQAAMKASRKPGTRIYLPAYGSWNLHETREPRSADSIILADGLFERIEADMRSFLDRKDWYHANGLLWKRGYLLHGEPGNGKSSLVFALAAALDYHVCCLNLAADDMSDSQFQSLMAEVPARCLVLIEEADTAIENREASEKPWRKVSLGAVLNVLDGYASREGSILFMTTNYIDRLDPALIRPGRMDRHFYLGPASPDQVERMFKRFYPNWDPFRPQVAVMPQGFSMAAVQEACLANLDDPGLALRALHAMSRTPLVAIKAEPAFLEPAIVTCDTARALKRK